MVTNMSSTSLAKAPSTSVTSAAFCFRTGSPMMRIACGATTQGYRRTVTGPSSQYFARQPAAASDRRAVALSLPDLELSLTDRPRGLLHQRRRPRHPTAVAGGAPSVGRDGRRPRPRLRLRAHRHISRPPGTGSACVGRRRERAGGGAVRRERGGQRGRTGPSRGGGRGRRAARRSPRRRGRAARPPVRGHLVEPADPDRQGRPPPAPHPLARPPAARGQRLARRATPSRRRLAGGVDGSSEGWSTERLVSRSGYRLLEVSAR